MCLQVWRPKAVLDHRWSHNLWVCRQARGQIPRLCLCHWENKLSPMQGFQSLNQTFFALTFNTGTFGTLWGFASEFSQKRAAGGKEVNSEGFFLQLDRLGESARGGKRMRWWLQVRLVKRPWGEQNIFSEKYHYRKRWYMENNRCGRRYRSPLFFSSECLNLSQTELNHNDGLIPSSDHLGRALELLSSC